MISRLSDHLPTWWGRLATRVRGWYSLDVTLKPLEDKWVKAARLRVKVSPEMRAQFRAKQPTLSDVEVDLVVDAVRQWVRVEGRNPEAVLPSRAVYELEVLRGEAPRMFVPDPGTPPYNRKDPSLATLELQSTFADAFRDESSSGLPLLFRVDEEVRWPGGLSYRGACTKLPCRTIDVEGRICLHTGWVWSVPSGPSGGGF